MPQCPIKGCWHERAPGLVMCAEHHDELCVCGPEDDEERDNDKLIRLSMDLQERGVTHERVRELRDHVAKCQNRDTCDGTVDSDVWSTARRVFEAADMLLTMLNQMRDLRH